MDSEERIDDSEEGIDDSEERDHDSEDVDIVRNTVNNGRKQEKENKYTGFAGRKRLNNRR